MERAWREMPPSGLERGAPYLRSPLMGQPMCASWQRALGDEGLVEFLVAGHPVRQESRFRRRLAAA